MSGYRVHVDSDRVLGELLDEIAEQLAGNGHEVVRGQDLRMPDGEYGDGPLHAIVVNSRTPVRADFLDLHPELRGVVFASSGVNSIDLRDPGVVFWLPTARHRRTMGAWPRRP